MSEVQKKRIVVAVTNDVVTDQRVHKVCESLIHFGYDVLLVGRLLPGSLEIQERSYKVKRMKLWFRRSFFFYAEYNIRLFFLLLFCKTDKYLSNDLDTLFSVYMASLITRKEVFYDSHEYFTEVPELVERPLVRKVWESVEALIFPKLKNVYTVSDSVAQAYSKKYQIDVKVVRNFPRLNQIHFNSHPIQLDTNRRIIIYQGVVNIDRGIEEAIQAMKYVENAVLYIVGKGDISNQLKLLVEQSGVADSVVLYGKVPLEQLPELTKQADLGISLEKKVGLNYTYALPNKFFDYIHAEIPILCSRLVEIEKIIQRFEVGSYIENHDVQHIASCMNEMLNNIEKRKTWKSQLKRAKEAYCWENEEKLLEKIFKTSFP